MIAALDIGGTKIAAGIVSAEGRVLAYAASPTCPEFGFEEGAARMGALLRSLAHETGVRVRGLGIGCTGPVDPVAGTILRPEWLRGWWDTPIVDRLARELEVPAAIENDADAVALAEAWWGRGRDAECLAYITIGTGIGGGIVRNGALYRGANGAHPEVGHIPLDVSAGPKCYCGLTGCWESLASGPAIAAWYDKGIPAEEIFRRAGDGESRAQEAVARTARYIGLGLVSIAGVYCPDVILLGGGVARSASLFLEDVRRTVRDLATQVPAANLRIDVVEHAETAGLQGAAAVWLHRYGRPQ